jgi:hypothetical protein
MEGIPAMLRAVLIATSLVLASSSFAQQVRVISGDVEHVYGRGGELLDDADQQARSHRAREHMQAVPRRLRGCEGPSREETAVRAGRELRVEPASDHHDWLRLRNSNATPRKTAHARRPTVWASG